MGLTYWLCCYVMKLYTSLFIILYRTHVYVPIYPCASYNVIMYLVYKGLYHVVCIFLKIDWGVSCHNRLTIQHNLYTICIWYTTPHLVYMVYKFMTYITLKHSLYI